MLKPSLSQLPISFRDEAVLCQLSIDAQIYLQCKNCGWETRLHPIDLKEKRNKPPQRFACGSCKSKGGKTVVRHLLKADALCVDCGNREQILMMPWDESKCSRCQSHNLQLTELIVDPPFPVRFGVMPSVTLMLREEDASQPWGINGEHDARLLRKESRWTEMMPDETSYLLTLILFIDRLRFFSEYKTWEDKYWIDNIEANCCQNYFRKTGSVTEGLQALSLFGEMATLPPDDVNRALAEHSYAMGAYSLLAKYGENYVAEVTERSDIRLEAAAAAMRAEQTLLKLAAEKEVEGIGQQIARIQYVIGDLLRVGNTDEEQRLLALSYFEQALQDPTAAARLGFSIRESRAATIMDLQDPSEEQLEQAIQDLGAAAKATGSDVAYENRWRPTFLMGRFLCRNGHWRKAIPILQDAASLTLQRFSGFWNETLLLHEAESYVPVFELLATAYTDAGWSDEALAAVEITRAAAVRLYSMLSPDRNRLVEEMKKRQLEDLRPAALKDSGLPPLSPQTSKRHIDDYFEEDPVGPAVMSLLNRLGGRAAFLCIFLTEGIATALICRLADGGKWRVDRQQWRPDSEKVELLRGQNYILQGPFRERLIKRACSVAYEALLQPLATMIADFKIDHCILSVPGFFSRLPFEAFGPKDSLALLEDKGVTVSYLPSVRLGADLVGRSQKLASRADLRVLVVGYDGEDIPRQEDEVASMRSIWPNGLTFLPGKDCTKASVIKAMNDPYDVIHILCHGAFDENQPLNSALYFSSDRQKDSRRVTAQDILSQVNLRNHPLVVLSACSSAMTADSRTNSFHGLCGSLFRVGARAIVGSRWPVADDAAAALMADFHKRLAGSTDIPEQCLDKARRAMRDAGRPLEDWAAFGYFGIS
jgi:CHAT domain-containing protein